MGRNIFQSTDPVGMMKAVNTVVHKKYEPKEAYELFKSNKK
jgi:putative autoinducer-2 (AI-2) aldolase